MGQQEARRIIVVGAGVSGMTAAVTAADLGAKVTLLSSQMPMRSASSALREGLALSLSSKECQTHIDETHAVGEGLAPRAPVERMCQDAKRLAEFLERIGLCFERTAEGSYCRTVALGSAARRVLRAGRAPGHRVLAVLQSQLARHAAHGRIDLLWGWECLSPVQDEAGRCCGVTAQHLRNMELKAFPADAVILCTGGYEALFAQQGASAQSDGFAIMACAQKGATIANPEFVQIAPCCLPLSSTCAVVSDAVLTAGAHLWVEREGKPWYLFGGPSASSNVSPTRNLLVQALVRAWQEMGGEKSVKFFLDMTHQDPDWFDRHGAAILDLCDLHRLPHPGEAPIHIMPGVGQTMGGLFVDGDHATTLPGLFAAGGAACLYHGAGLLGGNELVASLHGGQIAARTSCAYAAASETGAEDVPASLLTHAVEAEEDVIARISAVQGSENASALSDELATLLFETASLVKEEGHLKRAQQTLEELAERAAAVELINRKGWANAELFFHRRLLHRVELARLVLAASLRREESRGSHVRIDFPERDDRRWRAVTRARWNGKAFEIDTRKVSDAAGALKNSSAG